MHQREINPSLENNAIKSNLGQTQKKVLFFLWECPWRNQKEQRARHCPPLSSTRSWDHQDAARVCAMTDKPLRRSVPGQDHEQHNCPWNTRNIAKNPQHLQLRAIQRAPGKISFPGKIPVNHCGSDSTPWRFCTCRITPAWKSHNFGACTVPPEIPAGKLLQETVREPELSPRQWGWLGNGCDFYSPKFDRLPRFVLFVFLRETFYGTQKYFANENKKATYRRLCEPPHRQMLLNTVFNWD